MGDEQRVRLPQELAAVPKGPLEDYVRLRLIQFAGPFARRLSPGVSQQIIQSVAVEVLAQLPQPEYGRPTHENRDLQLVFRHDCLSLGCLDPQCVLCEHNPHRRCNVNFAPKYLVNDLLKAKCDAPIRVEVIDRVTGVPLGEDIPDVHLEMCILDGNAYDSKCLEAGQERDEDLDACSLLVNNKQSMPLLVTAGGATHNHQNKVVVQLQRGVATLPDLHVSDSSEAMLSGRKPPFRLLVRAVHADGRKVNIRHAVSEGFVVATRRTRTAGKVEIPNVDDHVSKLEHMGKETVKKLQDIKAAAQQAGVDVNIDINCVLKVGEFRKLALMAEADGHLRQKLQQVLKLSKEKWDDARDHALRAVVADNRMRIWYADKTTMDVGLLFGCRLGNVDLDKPVGLLQKKAQEGAHTTMEATLMAQQTPSQREQVRQLTPIAQASWWQPGHPAWAIYPVDTDTFLQAGANPGHMEAPSPIVAPHPPQPPINAGHLPMSPPMFGNSGGWGAPSHMGPPAAPGLQHRYGGGPGGGYQLPGRSGADFRVPDPPMSSGMDRGSYSAAMRPPAVPNGHPSSSGGPGGHNKSPFEASPVTKELPQYMSQQSKLAEAIFNPGSLSSADLSRFPNLPSLTLPTLATFPSIPQSVGMGMSSDLDYMMNGNGSLMSPGGAGHPPVFQSNIQPMARGNSIGMDKLESMQLPDTVSAVAMMHDMRTDGHHAGGAGGPGGHNDGGRGPAPHHHHSHHAHHGGGAGGPGAGAGSGAGGPHEHGGGMTRANSGLESMQSIEQALQGTVEGIMDKAAEEYARARQQQSHGGR